jgi:hypothetical protein
MACDWSVAQPGSDNSAALDGVGNTGSVRQEASFELEELGCIS